MSTMYTEAEVEQKIRERLIDITTKAHQAADDAGHCPEFDRIAELAGLPARSKVFRFTVPLEVEVEAPDHDRSDIAYLLSSREGYVTASFTGVPTGVTIKSTKLGELTTSGVERVIVFPEPEAPTEQVQAAQADGSRLGDVRTTGGSDYVYRVPFLGSSNPTGMVPRGLPR